MFGVLQSVALATGFQTLEPWVRRSNAAPVKRSFPRISVQFSNGRFVVRMASHFHSAIACQASLVYSSRADYSVDALPSETDRWKFLDHPAADRATRSPRRVLQKMQDKLSTNDKLSGHLLSHLLVIGVSATENRSKSFLRHLWQYLPEEFKIFWLCHSDRDVGQILRFYRELPFRPQTVQTPKLHILRHTNPGLFLLHAYQYSAAVSRRGELASRLPPGRLYPQRPSRTSYKQTPLNRKPWPALARSTIPTKSRTVTKASIFCRDQVKIANGDLRMRRFPKDRWSGRRKVSPFNGRHISTDKAESGTRKVKSRSANPGKSDDH